MKRFFIIAGLMSCLAGSVMLAQENKSTDASHAEHVLVRPEALKWGPPPPGLPPGSQLAVLKGDPAKAGEFVVRARMPDGYKVPAHWHSIDENITVLAGTMRVASGDRLDASALEDLPAGSFCHMPGGMRHFVVAKGETIIQIHGVGPFDITYINPADDPRGKQEKK